MSSSSPHPNPPKPSPTRGGRDGRSECLLRASRGNCGKALQFSYKCSDVRQLPYQNNWREA